jgi:RNA polymerase sigma factor (sigma-70 family)
LSLLTATVMSPDRGVVDSHDGFASWYEEHYVRMVGALVVVTGDRDVAAEAASEAFARALARWDRVSAMDSPTGWTYTVALNVARRMHRRARVEALLLRRNAPDPPIRGDAVDVWDAVRRLPDRQRTAVVLHYLSDLPQREVARAMGVAEGTVAATLNAARQTLATSLSPDVTHQEVENG